MIRWLAIALGPLFFATTPEITEEPGYGRTVEEAKLVARQAALERLQKRLAQHEPPLMAWRPTLTDIEDMLDGPGYAGKADTTDGIRFSWVLKVSFPAEAEVQRRDRAIRRQYETAVIALAAIMGAAGWWGALNWRERRRRAAASAP